MLEEGIKGNKNERGTVNLGSYLRLASSRPTSPIRMAMQMAAAAAFGYIVARAPARMITAVANHILSENKA